MGSQICSSTKVNQQSNNRKKQKLTCIKQNVVIKSKSSGRVLDICQDKDAFGTLIIYENWGGPNQRFDIFQAGQYVYIASHNSGKYLTVGSNSQKNGAPIYQQPTQKLLGQKFRLAKLTGNQYFIHTFCGKVIQCLSNETANGVRVVQQDSSRGEHQIWIIQ